MTDEPIDYAKLLEKYIRHVGQSEGVDFILGGTTLGASVKFTAEEWAELERIAKEIDSSGLWSDV